MRHSIDFHLGLETRSLRGVSPTMTVLDYLRTVEKLHGTKEGCAEGDCGACTVAIGEIVDGIMRYRAVNACIMFLPALDGKHLLTVEHLRGPQGGPHPVQSALVAYHASQCGFCTPGFAMSLFCLHNTPGKANRADIVEALAGNLCRCTGYRPIVDAALSLPRSDAATPAALPVPGERLELTHEGQTWIAPRSAGELAAVLLERPGAVLVAGGTDAGLWVTKDHRRLETIVTLEAAGDMTRIEEVDGVLRIGAAAVYEDARPALEAYYPDFGLLLRRLGSRQIRHRGTFGGNIANGSPIGDTPPPLIALDATLVLRRGTAERAIPIAEFFLGYRRTALAPGEFIVRIDVPLPRPGTLFRCYKLSKRQDQDISAVCGAFRLECEDGVVADLRIGFGGMAATPMRAAAVEQTLIGRAWTEAHVREAMEAMDTQFDPISDMRASAAYRRLAARNLLWKFWLETTPSAARTRLEPAA